MSQFRRDVADIIKTRISVMQILTVGWGYWLAHPNPSVNAYFIYLCLGTFLISCGSGMLNHYLERQTDCAMIRTQQRPLPTGRFDPNWVFIAGALVSMSGLGVLFRFVTPLAGIIAGMTSALYLLVYTPLKRVTWLNTVVGTIPGALPPVGGWVAGAVHAGLPPLSWGAGVLFIILVAWQHPHFYAIGCLYKDDYKQANLPILPNEDPDGTRMRRHIVVSCIVMMLAGYQLYSLSILGFLGFITVISLTVYYFALGLRMTQSITDTTARSLLKGSIIYLVGLMIVSIL